MATAGRRPYADLIERLRRLPARYELLQAVRLLERAAAADEGTTARAPLGLDSDPRREALILRSVLELGFPSADVVGLELNDGRPELTVSTMALTGACGVLPGHYAQLVLEASRAKNTAARDFLDLFNHRALSLFLRAAAKYRLPLSYERGTPPGSRSEPRDGAQPRIEQADAIGEALAALVGIGLTSLKRRQRVPDETLVFYCGHFARHNRAASGLAEMLSEYFGQPVTVAQFQGRWIGWRAGERTRLGARSGTGRYTALGRTAVIGTQMWDVQSSFRVSLGPLGYEEFQQFLPGSARLSELAELTRTYAGPTLSFDVQLTLRGAEVPPLRLSRASEPGARLGRNAWLPARAPRGDASDAIFAIED
jgi:type VI secretion system protein ImpH